MDASRASNSREAKIRMARRKKLLSEMLHGDEIPTQGIYPGLGERWSRPKNSQVAIKISAHSIRRLTEKIVRGIFFVDGEQFIESPYSIDFYALTDIGAVPVKELLDRFGKEYARGPGIQIIRAITPEDGVSAIISIEIWGTVKMYASVMSE